MYSQFYLVLLFTIKNTKSIAVPHILSKTGKWRHKKGSSELYCLFKSAYNIVDAFIVLWSQNKFSPNPAPAPARFEFLNPARSGSGWIRTSQMRHNPSMHSGWLDVIWVMYSFLYGSVHFCLWIIVDRNTEHAFTVTEVDVCVWNIGTMCNQVAGMLFKRFLLNFASADVTADARCCASVMMHLWRVRLYHTLRFAHKS